MAGGLLIGFVELFGAAYLSPHLRDVYVFSLLIAVCSSVRRDPRHGHRGEV
jgi:branched-subunit amino acid ABC-type transport system permease component